VYAERQKALRMPEVLWRMNFFGPYGYLREAVHAFAKKRDLDALTPDRFEQFLNRIDERITANYSADRWLRLLDPLFQTARRALGREQVPVSLLEAFFAEKGHTAIERRMASYIREGHDEVGPQALHLLIEEAKAGPAPSESRPSSRPEERPSAPSEQRMSDPEPPRSEPNPSDDDIWGVAGAARPEGSTAPQQRRDRDESVPLWKQFQQGRKRPASTTNETERDHNEGRDAEGEQEPLWARFRQGGNERLSEAVSDASADSGNSTPSDSVSEPSATSPSSSEGDLDALEREALGVSNPPHRAVYVRQLFGGDRAAYRQVLQRLSSADSWGEASQIIARKVFRAHKVNIYSDAAVHFTNAVESRFRQ
jgi:hypothetical protein